MPVAPPAAPQHRRLAHPSAQLASVATLTGSTGRVTEARDGPTEVRK